MTLLTNIMTIMKKTSVKYLILSTLIIGTLTLIIILNYKHSRITQVLNYPKNYSLCNTSNFITYVYSDNQELSFLDLNNIDSSTIVDEEENYYQVKIKNIVLGDKYLIENHGYYQYELTINLPFKTDMIQHLNNAYLIINNKKGEEIRFNIGNISIVNSDSFSIVELKTLSGIAKIINNYSTLDKIKMELYNFQTKDVILRKVELVSNVAYTNIDEVIIKNNQVLELVIPIIYNHDTFLNEVGIILTWEYQGTLFEQLISSYTLFNTNSHSIKPLVQVLEIH